MQLCIYLTTFVRRSTMSYHIYCSRVKVSNAEKELNIHELVTAKLEIWSDNHWGMMLWLPWKL